MTDTEALEELAKCKVDCNYKLKQGLCKPRKCDICEIGKSYNKVYNALNDVYKIKLRCLIAEKQRQYSKVKWQREIGKISFFAAILILCTIVVVIAIAAIQPTQSITDYKYSGKSYVFNNRSTFEDEYRELIYQTLYKTNKYMLDVNGDGLTNCIDAAITFTVIFRQSAKAGMQCEIVRNKNGVLWHHLFVRCSFDSGMTWEYIEPQAPPEGPYFMEDYWSARYYNPVNNITGETETWLNKRIQM